MKEHDLINNGLFPSQNNPEKDPPNAEDQAIAAKDSNKSIYDSLGVRPLINASGTVTIVGAVRMLPEVQKAMDDAVKEYVHLFELMDGVGRRLSELTGAESGCITSGASAAVTAGTAACVTGGDPDKLWKLPDTRGMKDEVIIPAYSRTAYDAAAKAVGVRMIEVDTVEDLKAALGPRTAMILVLGGSASRTGPLSLKIISDLAKPHGVPILVDAAAEGLEVPNPHLSQGADLVAYSGGKKLRGPQCSGMLIGRADLISAARINTGPHHGFGRGYKVGREEIMGLMAAVETWFKRDQEAELRVFAKMVENIKKRLDGIDGLTISSGSGAGLALQWDMQKIPLTGYDVEQLLWDNTPRIAVSLSGSYLPFPPNLNPNVRINVSQLEPGEENIIAERTYEIFSNPPKLSKPQEQAKYNLSGIWDLEMDFGVDKVMQTMSFEQDGNDFVGTHFAGMGPRDLAGSMHGTDILMRSSYTLEGVRINYTFTGNVSNDSSMAGKVSLSEYGKAKWSAKRRLRS